MEVYAAMVDRLDQNVGRVITSLKRSGRLKDTLVIFLSDNGAAGETEIAFAPVPGVVEHIAKADNSFKNIGKPTSFVFYGPYWAQAATAPAKLYKGSMAEGGIHIPAFVTYGKYARQQSIGRAYADVMDIVPTVLATAGLPIADLPIRGKSMLSYLSSHADRIHTNNETIAIELHGQRSVRMGDWKLVKLSPKSDWALYDIAADPSEQHDLSTVYPAVARSMEAAWDNFQASTRIP